ncbi:hypothetical protein ACTFIV_009527 [Dictyostelium citrinum]
MNQQVLKRQYSQQFQNQQDNFYQQQLNNQPHLNLTQQINSSFPSSCQYYNNNFLNLQQVPDCTYSTLSTMPNNNSNFFIDNNNLQFSNAGNNYLHNSYPYIMENGSCTSSTTIQQTTNQLTQQQQLYSNNNQYFEFNNSQQQKQQQQQQQQQIENKNIEYDVENGNYIYTNSNSISRINSVYQQNFYNTNNPSLQMAQENPSYCKQPIQYQQHHQQTVQQKIDQQQYQQPTTQQTLQPIVPQKQQQSQQFVQQQQQSIIQKQESFQQDNIEQKNKYQKTSNIKEFEKTTIFKEKSIIRNEKVIEKDLIEKTLEHQQQMVELKINDKEKESISQQQKQHQIEKEKHEKLYKKSYLMKANLNEMFPKAISLESWNFVGETTSRIYQTLNSRADFHKKTSYCRVLLVKKIFSWLVCHDKEFIKNHKTVDLVIAISDIINMIISLIELHRAPSSSTLYLILYSSDRFVERTGINHHQIFNLLLTSAIVNLKFWNESLYIQNKTIADIFSFSVKDLNTMERRFLYGLDYNLCVTPHELDLFINSLKKQSISSSNFLK